MILLVDEKKLKFTKLLAMKHKWLHNVDKSSELPLKNFFIVWKKLLHNHY